MAAKRRDIWGFAVGTDRSGDGRRITVYQTDDGFDFVSETLYCHHVAGRRLSADELRGEAASVFGLKDVKFEFPHLGIFLSSPAPKPKGPGLSRRPADRFSSR